MESEGMNGGRVGKNAASDPVLAALDRIERRLARLEDFVEKADHVVTSAPPMIGTALDTVDSLVRRLADAGVDVDERMRVVLRVAERLTAPEALEAVVALLDKVDVLKSLLEVGVFDEAPVRVVAAAGRALATAAAESPTSVGAWGAVRALGDPEVQRTLGFALRVAKILGRDLDAPRNALGASNE